MTLAPFSSNHIEIRLSGKPLRGEVRDRRRRAQEVFEASPAAGASSVVSAASGAVPPTLLTQHGPRHVDFLGYRPVLDNAKLKSEFGYLPQKTTAEAFEVFVKGRHG